MFASLVLSTAAATKKKKRKEEAYPWKAGTSSGHITNLKQSVLDFRYLWLFSCTPRYLPCLLFSDVRHGPPVRQLPATGEGDQSGVRPGADPIKLS